MVFQVTQPRSGSEVMVERLARCDRERWGWCDGSASGCRVCVGSGALGGGVVMVIVMVLVAFVMSVMVLVVMVVMTVMVLIELVKLVLFAVVMLVVVVVVVMRMLMLVLPLRAECLR